MVGQVRHGSTGLMQRLSLMRTKGDNMLRTTLAALAVTAVLASVSAAGDCTSCGYGNRSGGYAANAWDNYCGCDGGTCGNACGGCNRCCFPLIHNTLHRVGRVFDALLPDPCCRRSCGTIGCGSVGCAQPSCGFEPGCGIVGPGDPFIDDHHPSPPMPTPAADARSRSWSNARMSSYPKPAQVIKPRPAKSTAAPKSRNKVAKAGKSVLKVAYAEVEAETDEYYDDAPPAAPASVRNAAKEPAALAPSVRVAAKPVVSARSASVANPLRP
jgi:hypothetical protein